LKHLLLYENEIAEKKRLELVSEADQLVLIFAAILRKLDD